MKNTSQTLKNNKAVVILKCCLVALAIACAISIGENISFKQFIQNILEWESI
jgi:hypothetical protein